MKKLMVFILTMILSISSFAEKIKDDIAKIKTRRIEYLTGILEKDNIKSPEIKELIETNERYAETVYDKINKEKNKKYLFSEKEDMTSGVTINNSYREVKVLAKAYATKGSKYYKNEDIKNVVVDAMDYIYEKGYHEDAKELGNWWQWEIGIPKDVNDIVMLMGDGLTKEQKEKYLGATAYFQPDAKYSGMSPTASYSSSPDKRVSTGGNRTDTSVISFMRGINLNDEAQVKYALDALVEVGEYVTKKDGFYRDGSFVQHGNVAYNGTYAAVLFSGVGEILYLVKDTEFEKNDERLNNIYDSILRGYSYLFINGGINDSVSGRSISRNGSSDLERGKTVLGTVALLSEGAPEEFKTKMQSLIKTTILSNNSEDVIAGTSSRTIREILKKIVEDKNVKAENTVGNKIFGAMDRVVSKNNKGGAVVLSMHSSRIANFETMNGENVQGWFTGEGMTYIYGKDSKAYTEFWPTVDMYHLSGVTNSLKFRADKSGERRGMPTPKSWVGGVNTKEAFVGMDMLSWNKELEAKKVYLMKEDGGVFVTGYNIKGTEGEIHTTIDNRILNSGKLFVDGKEIKEDTVIDNPKNLVINFSENYKNENIGYKIIEAPQVVIKFEERKGNWKKIGGTSTDEIVKKYVTIYINHKENPKNDKYSYVILPMFIPSEVAKYDISQFNIKEMNENIFAMKDEENNLTRIHFWKDSPMKFEKIKSFSTASVVLEENHSEGTAVLYLADPTQLAKYNSEFELDGNYTLDESSTKDVEVKTGNGVTNIKINLRNNGATEVLKLRRILM
ncbi:polysaccharide lyase 8 family protein [Fusobacterium sp.]|uniref:polysaccharide lyase 8 family protein n=1 Tax=Fusobacterium sp. TaxID=68766 RepID=UPI002629B77F|nr:polysaccharide lyase 8 family protein [Fusobacterium sp.]